MAIFVEIGAEGLWRPPDPTYVSKEEWLVTFINFSADDFDIKFSNPKTFGVAGIVLPGSMQKTLQIQRPRESTECVIPTLLLHDPLFRTHTIDVGN